MPLLRITANGDRPVLHGADSLPDAALHSLLATPGPVTIMIHGYKFRPDSAHCPFRSILSLRSVAKGRLSVSWPHHLGISRGRGAGISFGWNARGSLRRAYRNAAPTGRALARLIARLHALAPHRPICVVAHSLGARVYLQALPHLPALPTRAVLMAGAEFACTAAAALDSPAGRRARILNVTSRENDVFDWLFERCLPAPGPRARALGHGLAEAHPNWHDLQIDNEDTRRHLDARGHRIPPPARRICHWFPYLRPGLFGLYRAFLNHSGPEACGSWTGPAAPRPCRRWARILPAPRRIRLLPGPAAPI